MVITIGCSSRGIENPNTHFSDFKNPTNIRNENIFFEMKDQESNPMLLDGCGLNDTYLLEGSNWHISLDNFT